MTIAPYDHGYDDHADYHYTVLTTVEIDTREVEALRIIVEFHMDDDDEEVREIHSRLAALLARAEKALERA